MKSFKLYAILGLCFGMLFLTACGDGENSEKEEKEETKTTPVLSCNQEEDGGILEVKVFYNKDEKTPENAELTLSIEIPEDTSDDEVEEAKEQLEMAYCDEKLKCDVNRDGDYLVMNVSGNIDDMIDAAVLNFDQDDDLSLNALKEKGEENGASCTKSYE